MKIRLNGGETEIKGRSGLTVTALIAEMELTAPHLLVRVNGRLIKKDSRDHTLVKERDAVEILPLVGGG